MFSADFLNATTREHFISTVKDQLYDHMILPSVSSPIAPTGYLRPEKCACQTQKKGNHSMPNLDVLTAQVTKNTDVEASAVQLLNNLAAALVAAKNDPVAIQALADQLKTSGDALAAAIVANTPVA